MFQGRMSRRALSRTEGRSSCRFTSGEKRTTAATGSRSGHDVGGHQRRGQSPAARVTGDDELLGGDAARQEAVQGGRGVLEVGRERELGGESQVGHEDVAPCAAGQPRREHAVHAG